MSIDKVRIVFQTDTSSILSELRTASLREYSSYGKKWGVDGWLCHLSGKGKQPNENSDLQTRKTLSLSLKLLQVGQMEGVWEETCQGAHAERCGGAGAASWVWPVLVVRVGSGIGHFLSWKMDLLLRNAATCNVSFSALALLFYTVHLWDNREDSCHLLQLFCLPWNQQGLNWLLSCKVDAGDACLYHSMQKQQASVHVMGLKNLEWKSGDLWNASRATHPTMRVCLSLCCVLWQTGPCASLQIDQRGVALKFALLF